MNINETHTYRNHNVDEVPDLDKLTEIKYRSGSEEKTHRAINDIARQWEAIGRELGVEEGVLKAEPSLDNITAATNMINHWIHTDKNATWSRLTAAMRDGGNLISEAAKLETALLSKST